MSLKGILHPWYIISIISNTDNVPRNKYRNLGKLHKTGVGFVNDRLCIF